MSQVSRRATSALPGVGDVDGPNSSLDGQIVIFDGITGKKIRGGNEIHIDGSGQTIGATTSDLITLDLGAIAGSYSVQVRVVGFDSSTPSGAVYQIDGGARTDGASATLIGQSQEVQEEIALIPADVQLVVSGNDLIVRATGVAALTIDWTCSLQYILQT